MKTRQELLSTTTTWYKEMMAALAVHIMTIYLAGQFSWSVMGREGAPPAGSIARSGRSALQGGAGAVYDDEAPAKVKINYMQVARLG